jgi:farnesyl-diphosphate farnesyltransferase
METGMADFAHQAALSPTPLTLGTVEDLDLYCHYVAGLVGEGLSRLFAASKKEAPWIASQLSLSNSCGLLLQKTNILRDYSEDCDEKRYFWPKEIWAPYGFKDITQIRDPAMREQGMWTLSAMTLDALRHSTDALDYLTLLKNQSVFNFVAIPATMAMATLALCFMNEAVLTSNVKIRKAAAVDVRRYIRGKGILLTLF